MTKYYKGGGDLEFWRKARRVNPEDFCACCGNFGTWKIVEGKNITVCLCDGCYKTYYALKMETEWFINMIFRCNNIAHIDNVYRASIHRRANSEGFSHTKHKLEQRLKSI